MKNVEGNYEEILEWLESNTARVGYVWAHGDDCAMTQTNPSGPIYRLNVGLFSVNSERYTIGRNSWVMDYSREEAFPTDIGLFTVEDPENSHLITF